MRQIYHYKLSLKQMQAKTKSNGHFEGPMPLCGNGSFHINTVTDITKVNCAACLELWQSRPYYLNCE